MQISLRSIDIILTTISYNSYCECVIRSFVSGGQGADNPELLQCFPDIITNFIECSNQERKRPVKIS